jgi:hypothetical protein
MNTAPALQLRGSLYPGAVSQALFSASPLLLRRWDRAVRSVEKEQRAQLQALLAHSSSTDFGRQHGFSSLRSYESFERRVPVRDYDGFLPYINRMRAGTANVLVPERVRYFGNSSGSSDARQPKFLPISERQIAETRRAGADTLMRYLAWSKERQFLRGYTLGLFHPALMRPEGPVTITTNPFLMIERQPRLSRVVYLPDARFNTIEHYDDKMTAIAERYLDWDVRAVTGTTCWFPVLFERVLEVAARQGRKAKAIVDVWPNLRVLFGGGVSASAYLDSIRRLCGRDDITLVDTYNATEGGIYASTDHSDEPGMLMLPHRGTFFEFVPVEANDQPSPPRVPLWAVERNRPYAIVVTTSSGLFAYKLGDIVRFPCVSPPRIEFVGRLSGCLSITQELATHAEIEEAVRHALATCPCRAVEYGAAADVGVDGTAKSRYLLFVEFEPEATPDLDAFAAAFDEGMCRLNRVYREHRGVALLAPRVVPLVQGGAGRLLSELTGGNFQGKFPRILGDRQKSAALKHALGS